MPVIYFCTLDRWVRRRVTCIMYAMCLDTVNTTYLKHHILIIFTKFTFFQLQKLTNYRPLFVQISCFISSYSSNQKVQFILLSEYFESSVAVFNVRQSRRSTHVIARRAYRLDVCPSVCSSVTRYAGIVSKRLNLSSNCIHGSPMILVLWEPNFVPEFQWEHSQRGR